MDNSVLGDVTEYYVPSVAFITQTALLQPLYQPTKPAGFLKHALVSTNMTQATMMDLATRLPLTIDDGCSRRLIGSATIQQTGARG
jgi:hypothetical protein